MTPPSARALLAAATREELLTFAADLEGIHAIWHDCGDRGYRASADAALAGAALLRAVVKLGDEAFASRPDLNDRWPPDWGVNEDHDLTWGRDIEPTSPWAALSGLLPEPEETTP